MKNKYAILFVSKLLITLLVMNDAYCQKKYVRFYLQSRNNQPKVVYLLNRDSFFVVPETEGFISKSKFHEFLYGYIERGYVMRKLRGCPLLLEFSNQWNFRDTFDFIQCMDDSGKLDTCSIYFDTAIYDPYFYRLYKVNRIKKDGTKYLGIWHPVFGQISAHSAREFKMLYDFNKPSIPLLIDLIENKEKVHHLRKIMKKNRLKIRRSRSTRIMRYFID